MNLSLKKSLPVAGVVLASILLSGCQFVLPTAATLFGSPTPTPVGILVVNPTPTPSVVVTPIASPTATVIYSCRTGQTAYDALVKTDRKVEIKQTSLGKMVVSIDGQAQGNNKYWQYKINDKEAQVGAEAYHCQDGDAITWELK